MTKTEMGAVQPPVKKSKRGPGRPPKSKTQRIRDMVAAGASVKHITEKLGVSPQQVYQARYDLRKKELASKPRTVEKLPELGAPYGFTPAPVKNEGPYGAQIPLNPILYVAPKPTFWQRVKAVFFPN